MTNPSMRLFLTTTATVCLLLVGPHHSQAFEQEPRAVTDPNIDPGKLSEANRAAKVNQVDPQSNMPGFGTDKTVFGQGGDQHGPGTTIPGIDFSAGSSTPGKGTPLSGPKGVPGFENAGAVGVNLPGSSYQHGPDDIDKVLSKMGQEGRGIVDAATKGGPNSLNIPTGSSAPGVREADGLLASLWSRLTGSGSDKTSAERQAASDTTGNPTPQSNGPLVNTGTPLQSYTSRSADGKTVMVTVENPAGIDVTTIEETKNGTTRSYVSTYDNRTGAFSVMTTEQKTPGKGKNNTPDDNDTGSSAVGGLSPNSSLAKKGQGGGAGNNPEGSSAAVGGLASTSSYARRNHGDGGGDAGDNNNHNKVGGLASGTAFARKGYGDGGSSDNRGAGSGASTITGKPKGIGGGNGELTATKSSRVIGAGLLEGDSGFSAQGPAAAGVAASAAAPNPTTSRAAVTGRILGR
jgi:hypothetical protein